MVAIRTSGHVVTTSRARANWSSATVRPDAAAAGCAAECAAACAAASGPAAAVMAMMSELKRAYTGCEREGEGQMGKVEDKQRQAGLGRGKEGGHDAGGYSRRRGAGPEP